MMEEFNAKLDGLKELFNEKFGENSREHGAVWEQVKSTNGRVRLLEKAIWAIGGAMTILALLFSPSAVSAVIGLFK
jgi:hypothetical protein